MDASIGGRSFLDANILVYTADHRDPEKQHRAQALLRENDLSSFVVSAQVLSEFYWTVTRKLVPPFPPGEARAAIQRLARLIVVPVDRDLVLGAIELTGSASMAYWDALIVKAASTAGCQRLPTEDLNHGQTIDGVQIEDPFIGL